MRTLLAFFATALIVSSCSTQEQEQHGISGDAIAEHIKVLSSDDFEGRMPFTDGETNTIN